MYKFGPFNRSLYSIKESLERRGLVEERTLVLDTGEGHQWHSKEPADTSCFTPGQLAILDHIVSEFGDTGPHDLIDIADDTLPVRMVMAEEELRQKPLPMDAVNNLAKHELGGLDLESVLRGEEDIRRGRTVPWDHVRKEILDRVKQRGDSDN
jgi:hypothetical protein